MHPVPPTRPQQVYRPGPAFTPAQPVAPQFTRAPQLSPPAHHQQVPLPPPPTAQHRAPRQGNRKELTIAGAVIGGISLVIVIIVAVHSSSSPAYVSQLSSDGYTLTHQGTLTGGEGIGYAEGDNATGAGELVVQTKTADDAQATANGLQGNSDGADVATDGSMLIIQDNSYAVIQSVVTSNGW